MVCLAFVGSAQGKEVVFIGSSLKALAGAYRTTGPGYGISIGPDGKVTLNTPGATVYETGFLNGKITYFSRAGFVVNFAGMHGPVEMKCLFTRRYPTSFFLKEGKTFSIFVKQ